MNIVDQISHLNVRIGLIHKLLNILNIRQQNELEILRTIIIVSLELIDKT